MLRKFYTLFVVGNISMLLVSILASCASYDVYVCDVHLKPSDYTNNTDTAYITDTTGLEINVPTETTCYRNAATPYSACYAFSRAAKWQNELDTTSFRLHLDRPVTIASETIQPGTDLLSQKDFRKYAWFKKGENNSILDQSITYALVPGKKLMDLLSIDSDVYLATFSCSTNDGKHFVREIRVLFRK